MAEGRLTSASELARFLGRVVPEGVGARAPTPSWEKGFDVDVIAGDWAAEEGLTLILVCLTSGSRALDSVVDEPAGALFAAVDDAGSPPSGLGWTGAEEPSFSSRRRRI